MFRMKYYPSSFAQEHQQKMSKNYQLSIAIIIILLIIVLVSIPSRLVRCNYKEGYLFENNLFEELSTLNFPVQKNHMHKIPKHLCNLINLNINSGFFLSLLCNVFILRQKQPDRNFLGSSFSGNAGACLVNITDTAFL